MQQSVKKYITPEEYLALEESSDFKSEFYKGEIFNMAGTTLNHNQIVSNLIMSIGPVLRKKTCRLFANEIRLWVESQELFTYPDLMIVCDKLEFYPNRNDTITNPLIIIEVLSESTENYDRGKKFLFYRSIPSFQEYILIDQSSHHIEQFHIAKDGKWSLTEYNDLNGAFKFAKIDFEMPLRDIYSQVEFN